MHDVIIVAAAVDEGQRNEKRDHSHPKGVGYVLSFQNFPWAPLANFLPNRPIGLSSSIKVRIIIP